MFDHHGMRFFAALRAALDLRNAGGDHAIAACIEAVRGAIERPCAAATAAAQQALDALEPALLAQVLADCHRIMREDPLTLMGGWPVADRTRMQ